MFHAGGGKIIQILLILDFLSNILEIFDGFFLDYGELKSSLVIIAFTEKVPRELLVNEQKIELKKIYFLITLYLVVQQMI